MSIRPTYQALKEGLAHLDQYSPVPSDDTPIFAVPDDGVSSLHEFATSSGQLCVGHLRDLLAHLEEGN